MDVDIPTTNSVADDLSNGAQPMDQSDSNLTHDQPIKDLRCDTDSNIEIQLVGQQLPGEMAAAEDRYRGYVIEARATVAKVRATLNQCHRIDKLRMYLPTLEAVMKNLTNAPPHLTQETDDHGHRASVLLDVIYFALSQLNVMETHHGNGLNDTIRSQRRWLLEEYEQLVKENYENLCIFEEHLDELDPLKRLNLLRSVKGNFEESIIECRTEFDTLLHIPADAQPLTPHCSHSPGPSEQRAKKRKFNHLTSDWSKRFCSDGDD